MPMLEKVFDSQDLPVSDRVDAWRDIASSALVPIELSVGGAVEFRASVRAADMGGTQVTALDYVPLTSRRTPRLISDGPTRRCTPWHSCGDFIRRHLGDATLSPAAVAAAHHISLRTLHRLFRDHAEDITVASYIRGQRLKHARCDLGDPRLTTRPVHVIAARWGFLRPADFSRAFRTTYGSTPTEYRHGALRTDAGVHR